MRTFDIVIRLPKHTPTLKIGDNAHYATFLAIVSNTLTEAKADIVYKGDYFRHDRHLLPHDEGGFNSYALFRRITLIDSESDLEIWESLAEAGKYMTFPEIRETDDHHQLVELSDMTIFEINDSNASQQEQQDILIRIAGDREELAFDPVNREANTTLFGKLAREVYDREAELMYVGPRLNPEEHPDLFIHADEFSSYIILRMNNNDHSEEPALQWERIERTLRQKADLTMLRSEDHYQLLMLQPESAHEFVQP